jgi:hypothetical protein
MRDTSKKRVARDVPFVEKLTLYAKIETAQYEGGTGSNAASAGAATA